MRAPEEEVMRTTMAPDGLDRRFGNLTREIHELGATDIAADLRRHGLSPIVLRGAAEEWDRRNYVPREIATRLVDLADRAAAVWRRSDSAGTP